MSVADDLRHAGYIIEAQIPALPAMTLSHPASHRDNRNPRLR